MEKIDQNKLTKNKKKIEFFLAIGVPQPIWGVPAHIWGV
jgi:hypothetical protein